MLPGVCGDPSKANTGAGAPVVYELVAKSFRGAAPEAVPGPTVLQQCCSCWHWAKERSHNRSHASVWLHPFLPLFPTRSCSQQRSCPQRRVWGRAAQPSLGKHSFASPGCFRARTAPNHRAAVPHTENFGEELWGRVNLKIWLKRAPNTSPPHSESLQGDPHTAARLGVLLHPAGVAGSCS